MGAQHSTPTPSWTDHIKPMPMDVGVHHIKRMPSFKGNESDYVLMVLGLALLLYMLSRFLSQCVRKMNGTTRVTFAFHHKVNVGEEVRVVGNVSKLGQWDPNRAAPMKVMNMGRGQTDDPVWVGHVDLTFPLHQPLEYKYVLMTCPTGSHGTRLKEWEPCANRVLRDKNGARDGDALILHQYWGGRDKVCHDKVPDYGDLVGCNPLTQPLIAGA